MSRHRGVRAQGIEQRVSKAVTMLASVKVNGRNGGGGGGAGGAGRTEDFGGGGGEEAASVLSDGRARVDASKERKQTKRREDDGTPP